MKLLYDSTNGKVYYAVYDSDWFKFVHTTNIPLVEFTIDEVDPANKTTCRDLYQTQMKLNSEGLSKYYIQGGELYQRDRWTEYMPEVL